MALITCPECGNEVSDKAVSCPKCGYVLNEAVTVQVKKTARKHKNTIILCVVLALLAIGGSYISSNTLSADEQAALDNCRWIKSVLKNPGSFTLFDDIIVCHSSGDSDDPDTDIFFYIPYGGTNSYGAMLQDIAVFSNDQYMGDVGDEEDDFDSSKEYAEFVLARMAYDFWASGDALNGTYTIDAEKITRHMK